MLKTWAPTVSRWRDQRVGAQIEKALTISRLGREFPTTQKAAHRPRQPQHAEAAQGEPQQAPAHPSAPIRPKENGQNSHSPKRPKSREADETEFTRKGDTKIPRKA
jgi:hypothetical protein